jgi:hypothetical protein
MTEIRHPLRAAASIIAKVLSFLGLIVSMGSITIPICRLKGVSGDQAGAL